MRFRYESRRLLDNFLPKYIVKFFVIKNTKKLIYKKNKMLELANYNYFLDKEHKKLNKISFKFLNVREDLELPIKDWNNKSSRLWQFNLHYFDWSRSWLEEILLEKKQIKYLKYLPHLIDNWIDFNPISKGDGWHSYTLSLRIRNWILLFRFFPELATKKRLNSLWIQTCWLYSHPEKCHGGNHWLENIISLIISSLQFNSIKSEEIYEYAIISLKEELDSQILKDGGHQERSASYHILLLDRLTELAIIIEYFKQERPFWLIEKIHLMVEWIEIASLEKGRMPRFNDSPNNLYESNTDILNFAKSFLNKERKILTPVRDNLIDLIFSNEIKNNSNRYISIDNKLGIRELKDTGWYFLRPGSSWELVFKNGTPCPKHQAAHVHSDQLTFDLFFKGAPVFAEVGTSGYENISERLYERSGEAHNLIQFAIKSDFNKKKINWIESVEVWKSFRAARKSQSLFNKSLKINNKLVVSGENDSLKKINAAHRREISISLDIDGNLDFVLIDQISSRIDLYWRQWWHLGPKVDKKVLKNIIKIAEEKYGAKHTICETYYSEGFGIREKRLSLCLTGEISSGIKKIEIPVKIKNNCNA
ncbi:heparinase II/III domain-containing protein [Prochlorococcus marinus]|uniref:heparinase II/III domain-containing protein n=2 Tax=Prochlorococcus marinus TaxID=1219 RepID=UPI001C578685|nr:heparinase II/III family protein [Prochlorococcus marinus]